MKRLVLLACVATGCVSSVDPNKGTFSCTTSVDCGAGYECRKQFSGGGRCFKVGQCTDVELCDGTDNNCDGRVDETFPDAGSPCPTGKPGVCAVGALACVSGAVVCSQTVQPSAELCNGLDDNCDGVVDDGFDLTHDNNNCGVCGRVCDGGTGCIDSACHENSCGDGLDNDNNGLTDCDDPYCLGLECNANLPPSVCGIRPPGFDGGVDAGADGGVDGGDGGLDGGDDAGLDGGDDAGLDGGGDGGVSDGGPDGGDAGIRGCYSP